MSSVKQQVQSLCAQVKATAETYFKSLKENAQFLTFVERLETKRQNDDSGQRKIDAQKRRVRTQDRTQERVVDGILQMTEHWALSVAEKVRVPTAASDDVRRGPLLYMKRLIDLFGRICASIFTAGAFGGYQRRPAGVA